MDEIPIEKAAADLEVEIIANDICYQGTLVKFDIEDGRIILKEATMIKDKKTVSTIGHLRFFLGDIQSMKFIDEEAALRKMDPNYFLMKPFRKPFHLRGQNVPTDEDVLKIGRTIIDETKDDGTPSLFWSSSINCQILDTFDESFISAVMFLNGKSTLAVAGQGVALSRQGELCWLAIGIPTHVYLFDIVKLGEAAFREGLADILQSSSIVKIMHDCRFISDYLYHKHQIFLQNVWDTQVAKVVAYKQHHFGEMPRFVDSLPKALHDELGVDPNKFPFLWYRSFALEEDQLIWRKRPLPNDLLKVLEAQIYYLWDLRNALMQKLLQDLTTGVEIYLKAVRDMRSSEVGPSLESNFLLPAEFQQLADAAKERYNKSARKSTIDPLTGFRESAGRLSYWKLRFSRDAWHGYGSAKSSSTKEGDVEDDETEAD